MGMGVCGPCLLSPWKAGKGPFFPVISLFPLAFHTRYPAGLPLSLMPVSPPLSSHPHAWADELEAEGGVIRAPFLLPPGAASALPGPSACSAEKMKAAEIAPAECGSRIPPTYVGFSSSEREGCGVNVRPASHVPASLDRAEVRVDPLTPWTLLGLLALSSWESLCQLGCRDQVLASHTQDLGEELVLNQCAALP